MTEESQILGQLKQGLPVVMNTRGISMRPLLRQGKTQVLIEPLHRELEIGELPLFLRQDGRLVIHRLVGRDPQNYHTRGDNCISGESFPRENAYGVVTRIYRGQKALEVTDWRYRAYVSVWMHTAGIRIFWKKCLARLHSAASRVKHRLFP